MRTIHVDRISDAVRELCLKANFELRKDVMSALRREFQKENDPRARRMLKSIIDNAVLARKMRLAICQDTGVEIGRAHV